MGVTLQDQVLTGLPEKFIRVKIETDKTLCESITDNTTATSKLKQLVSQDKNRFLFDEN